MRIPVLDEIAADEENAAASEQHSTASLPIPTRARDQTTHYKRRPNSPPALPHLHDNNCINMFNDVPVSDTSNAASEQSTVSLPMPTIHAKTTDDDNNDNKSFSLSDIQLRRNSVSSERSHLDDNNSINMFDDLPTGNNLVSKDSTSLPVPKIQAKLTDDNDNKASPLTDIPIEAPPSSPSAPVYSVANDNVCDASTLSSQSSDGSTASVNNTEQNGQEVEPDNLRLLVNKAKANETTSKLANALSELWSAVSMSEKEAGQALQATRDHNVALQQQAREANDRQKETEACMVELASRCNVLEKENKLLSKEVDSLKHENMSMTKTTADLEKEYMNQMDKLVNMSMQTERDYKNMVAERDYRIAQLDEATTRLKAALVEVESRVEAEMRSRTWSDARRDSVERYTAREEALSQLEAPFSSRTRTFPVKADAESSDEIFRREEYQEYGLVDIATRNSSSKDLRYLGSRGSTRDEQDRMTAEDEGLHFI